MLLAEAVVNTCEDINHQGVRNKLTLVYITLGSLAKFCSVLNLCTQHVASGDVLKSVLFNQFVALGAFSRTGSTKNNNILHTIKLLLLWLNIIINIIYSLTSV